MAIGDVEGDHVRAVASLIGRIARGSCGGRAAYIIPDPMKLCLLFSSVVCVSALVGCAAPTTVDESASSESAIVESCDSAEAAAKSEARNTARLANVIADVLGAHITCTTSDVHRIVRSSSEAYFGSAVRCEMSEICTLAAADFEAAMQKRGWYGYHLVDGIVLGELTGRSYHACTPLPQGEEACAGDAVDTSRLAGLIGASLGVPASCAAATPWSIPTRDDHYYGAKVTCTVPSAAEAASYDARMKSFGWNGFKLSGTTITGTQTSRTCRSYGSPAASR